MGRLWLALVLVISVAAAAFADAPFPPQPPSITAAHLEIGDQRNSKGLYEVERLELAGTVGSDTKSLRIRLFTAHGDESVETTPDQLVLVHPALHAPVGKVLLEIMARDGRLESQPTRVIVVAERRVVPHCNELVGPLIVLGAVLSLVLMFGVLLKMRATEVARARRRGETEPTALPNATAEEHIRTVALRALFAVVVVTAIVVACIGIELPFVPIFGGPVLLVVGLTALVRVVNAGRAITLLHRPGAGSQTRYDQLEVASADRAVTLRSSPKLVERARRTALPRATL